MKRKESSYCSNNVDDIFNQLKEMCFNSAEEDVKLYVKELENENNKLRESEDSLKSEVMKLNERVKLLESEKHINSLSGNLFTNYKKKIEDIPYEEGEKEVLKLCKSLITPTYKVSDSDQLQAPVWIVLLTMFYNNRETVIQLMDYFNIRHPKNVNTFKLPCDWNEEELDYFMEAMPYNVNCNACVFEGNLKFWAPKALDSPKDQCITTRHYYTEIPWQFILRNPIIKKPKYLEQIGKNLFSSYVTSYINFLKLPEYQSLTDEELLLIINALDVSNLESARLSSFYKFIFEYVELLDEEEHKDILDKFLELLIKEHSYDSYSTDILLRMPTSYLNKWIKSVTPETSVQFILRQGKNVTDNKKLEDVYKSVVKSLKDSLEAQDKK